MKQTPFALPDKTSIKKKQSQLKTLIQDFGKLAISWNNDLDQLQILTVSLNKAVSLECGICSSSDKMSNLFPSQASEIMGLLLINIFREIEFVIEQIKLFKYVIPFFTSLPGLSHFNPLLRHRRRGAVVALKTCILP